MISFIVAMDKNKVIGKNNELPWHLPADLAFFKRVTMGSPIIMGRKTFESIGRPLPGRKNYILTRDPEFKAEGCTVVHSISHVKQIDLEHGEEVFVIGGSEIFKQTIDITDRLYLTYIDEEFEGDTYFSVFNEDEWELKSKEKGIKDEKNPYDYYYIIYDRK